MSFTGSLIPWCLDSCSPCFTGHPTTWAKSRLLLLMKIISPYLDETSYLLKLPKTCTLATKYMPSYNLDSFLLGLHPSQFVSPKFSCFELTGSSAKHISIVSPSYHHSSHCVAVWSSSLDRRWIVHQDLPRLHVARWWQHHGISPGCCQGWDVERLQLAIFSTLGPTKKTATHLHQGKSRWHRHTMYWFTVLTYLLGTVPCTLTMG